MFRDRLIDVGLLLGLVAVAFAIMWTLFTLGRSSEDVPPPRPTAEEPAPRPTSDIVAIAPDRPTLPTSDQPIVVTPPATTETEPAAEAETEAETTPEPDEPPPPPPLPEGAVSLERVGFSFVTGGAGACGITLEPWLHIAVSRDLLAVYPCGSEVNVTLADEVAGRTRLRAIVADTMNPVHSRTVNIYVAQDEPALQYGVTSGVFEP